MTFGNGWACAPLRVQSKDDKRPHFVIAFILDDRSVYVMEPFKGRPYLKEFKILRGDFA